MTNLEKLYQSLRSLEEPGISVSEKMQQEVECCEKELIIVDIIPRIASSIHPIIKQVQCPVSIMIHYDPGESLNIELAHTGLGNSSMVTLDPHTSPNAKSREATNEDEIESPIGYHVV
jgi:hypothetical protein